MRYKALKSHILSWLETQLPPHLYYHGLHHTLDVLKATEELCTAEAVGVHNTILLKTAALFHDAGFIEGAQDHELRSCELARKILPDFEYAIDDIDRIANMILATRMPQSPQNELEAILCDADLDYLGRDDFFPIAQSLFQELKHHGFVSNLREWDEKQIFFLENHSFFTSTNIERRRQKKLAHLQRLKEKL